MAEKDQHVVLVDEQDTELGVEEKNQAHHKGQLHRAISVFVFDDNNRMLIHKRAQHKYHSGGQWSNACCSHPMPEEESKQAAHRRIVEEMGFDLELRFVKSVIYKATLTNGMIEHELDHLFVGKYSGKVNPNPNEVSEFTYVAVDELKRSMAHSPDNYTPWFHILMDDEHLNDVLRTLESA